MTAQELKETGQRLFKSRQYVEAMPLLKSAAEAFPNDEPLWQELVLAAHHCGHYEQAVESAKQAIRQHPRSGWLWRQLGSELTSADRLEEAEKAFDNARSLLGHSDEWLWRFLAALCRKQKNLEKEIEALENLHALDFAKATDLNQLGIAYHNRKPPNFAKALEFYRLAAMTDPDTAYFFNMGLVFNDAQVSQDADAADAYRRALLLSPSYEKAKERLDATKLKLLPLAERARSEASVLIQPDDYFQFYQNPFEVFPIEYSGSLDELDAKAIQRATKKLLGEIKLNDGRVEWLENHEIDKSRALPLENELLDMEKRRFHWTIFDNQRLLRFLTRGEIEHFLYSDDYFPQKLLELLDEEAEFRRFISKPFARQYNFVLTRAIQRRALAVVESLFDGRRWVEPEDDDICFDGAYKQIKMLVEWMENKAENAETTKPAYSEIQSFIENLKVVESFNLLPVAFRGEQNRLVAAIREIAIACHNKHGDSELSGRILGLCKRFNFKSADLNKKLEEDFKTIEKIISEQRHTKDIIAERVAEKWQTKKGIADGERVTEQEPNWVFYGQRAEQQRELQPTKKLALGSLIFVVIVVVFVVIWTFDTSNTSSNNNSYTPPTAAPSAPTYTPPSFPSAASSESKDVYRVPSYLTAELNRDKQAIDDAKTKVERMEIQLKTAGEEIEQARVSLDRSSQFAVNEFNSKVDAYNILGEKIRAQDQLINQMVENYNQKLRMHGR